ncbi:MAG: tRNA lysidine(34) synthetase TilS [Oceanospirillaceae bacterium]|nr:tRNA lysidine(34) synthetase TilS [Oceanospirillaceae bacterium]
MGPVSLLSPFRRQLEAQPPVRRWLIGYSGGLDSRVLVELAASSLDPGRVLLLHVNHHLQPGADDWAQHCRQTAIRLGLAIRVLDVRPRSASEADARDARYAAFECELQPDDCLLLGHHADDQAETLLLRLLRGAGVRGLRGMPRQRPLGAGMLLRPLLERTRAELEAWARGRGLDWIEDPSNAATHYDRNYLRQRVMPALAKRWPDAVHRMGHSALLLDEADELLLERAQEDLASCGGRERLSQTSLRALGPARRRNLLRYWCESTCGVALNTRQLTTIEDEFLGAASDRQPQLPLGDRVLRRYRDALHLVPALDSMPEAELAATKIEPGTLCFPQGRLVLRHAAAGEVALRSLDGLSLRYRRDGERCRPVGRGGSHPLKKLFQECGVPPWQRDSWPLLVHGDAIVALPGLFICEGWQTKPDAEGFIVDWEPGGPVTT